MAFSSLLKQLQNFDWTYNYSDDPSMWRRGAKQKKDLQRILDEKKCPYGLYKIIYAIIEENIIENYVMDENGRYYDPKWKYNYARLYQTDMVTQKEYDEISKWVEENDNITS